MTEGITVKCVLCKSTRTISFDEAKALGSNSPSCHVCFMPMVAESAERETGSPQQ